MLLSKEIDIVYTHINNAEETLASRWQLDSWIIEKAEREENITGEDDVGEKPRPCPHPAPWPHNEVGVG